MDFLPFLFHMEEFFTHFVPRTFWLNVRSRTGVLFKALGNINEVPPFIRNCVEKGFREYYDKIIVINKLMYFMKQIKIILEKQPDGYVSYPLGLKGIVVGQGDTYEEALSNVKSAIRFHIETFGKEVVDIEPPVLEAFVAEAGVEI